MSNVWRQFLDLLPRQPVTIARVKLIHGDGTSTVQTPAGHLVRVQGDDLALETMAFIQGGRIIDEAPDLPSYSVDI